VVNGHLQDGLGRGLGHVLDACAALWAGHNERPVRAAVQHDGKVRFPPQVQALHEVHLVHAATLGARLLGHQVLAQHLRRELARLAGARHQMHATVKPVEELPQAAPPRQHLRLDHQVAAAPRSVRALRLRGRGGHRAKGHWHAVLLHEPHANVLVHVEKTALTVAGKGLQGAVAKQGGPR
jgi:hypothetical protein